MNISLSAKKYHLQWNAGSKGTNRLKLAVDKFTKFVFPFAIKYNTLLIYSYIFPEKGDPSLPEIHKSGEES